MGKGGKGQREERKRKREGWMRRRVTSTILGNIDDITFDLNAIVSGCFFCLFDWLVVLFCFVFLNGWFGLWLGVAIVLGGRERSTDRQIVFLTPLVRGQD